MKLFFLVGVITHWKPNTSYRFFPIKRDKGGENQQRKKGEGLDLMKCKDNTMSGSTGEIELLTARVSFRPRALFFSIIGHICESEPGSGTTLVPGGPKTELDALCAQRGSSGLGRRYSLC